ncbi:hypothetical protein MNR02_05350 [Shinella sp. H4-D48]|uniref:hypothetical protein n=1 Tax=Shinella sp. H4-D48 TaxID=2925841 RepID=UPI001F52CDA5|nr:hypothetical protein [Shinella sp. H4-D48]UNK39129.1 hypothetical protein MNR02_05350 [Shinella sp. H4-D48]
MKPDNRIKALDQFFAIGRTDTFVPSTMTFGELEEEFPPLPPVYCAITDRDDF